MRRGISTGVEKVEAGYGAPGRVDDTGPGPGVVVIYIEYQATDGHDGQAEKRLGTWASGRMRVEIGSANSADIRNGVDEVAPRRGGEQLHLPYV